MYFAVHCGICLKPESRKGISAALPALLPAHPLVNHPGFSGLHRTRILTFANALIVQKPGHCLPSAVSV